MKKSADKIDHRHLPDRRNSGNGCPPSCWGVYPRGRDSTSCRSGLRRSRIALLPAGSRWRSLRPKRQRCYLRPNGWVQAKRTKPGEGVGEVGFIHTSIRQSVVHLTSCCGTAWPRSSLRRRLCTFCCAVRSSQFDLRFLVAGVEPVFSEERVWYIRHPALRSGSVLEPVGLEIGASGLVHSKLCTMLLLNLAGFRTIWSFCARGLYCR